MKMIRNITLSCRSQKGLSLVELMVGMVLGLFLVLGVGQVFVTNNTTFRTQEGMAKVQEGGRYGMQRIASSVRGAGFYGCAGLDIITPNVIALNPPSDLSSITGDTPVNGIDSSETTKLATFGAEDGTDVITLRGAGDEGVGLVGNLIVVNANIQVENGYDKFVADDLIIITDCATADLFRANSVSKGANNKNTITHSAATNTSVNLSKPYGADAIILKPFIHSYFVKDTGRDNYRGEDILALYMRDIKGNDYELVEGVSDMQVLYGVDTDANRTTDRYMDAAAVTTAGKWDGVVSARISLLVDSVDDTLAKTAAYTFLGTSTTPSDRRLRKEFTGLFVLRNRAL